MASIVTVTLHNSHAGSCAAEDAGMEHKHTAVLLQSHLQQAGMHGKPLPVHCRNG